MELILASKSPRRAELLHAAGIPFRVRTSDIDESVLTGEAPRDYVLRMAKEKAAAVTAGPNEIVLAADTTVVSRGEIFGKPLDRADAIRMLQALANAEHEVLTGICLARDGRALALDCATTTVRFTSMTDDEIARYADSGEPLDKAGAYAIQGIASRWIDRIDGSYSNVVGLPVELVWRHLRKCGFSA